MTAPSRGECLAAAGGALAAARRARDELYAAGGAQAVAEAAWTPGGPSVEQLAEGFERLAQRARERPDAA